MIALRKRVFEALNNARANGYEFVGMSHEDIAVDLATYDADLENEDTDALAEHVGAWMLEKR